jgi:hypothetical protein
LYIAYKDKKIYYSLCDYNPVQDKSKKFDFLSINFVFYIKHTGHLTAFGDHLKTFESTIVDVHELSSSLGTLPINFFVQVLQQNSNKNIMAIFNYSGVRPQTAG